MNITAGIDVGSTYTKALILDENEKVLGKASRPTGFKLTAVARKVFDEALAQAGLKQGDVSYVIATGCGRHRVDFKDLHVTDLTAGSRGAAMQFPGTRTILDIGGQTMKASRIDESCKVIAFRLNDKCAAGTGAFLEKTARYMGFTTEEIGPLLVTAKNPASISGVCAVFAESEVINHLSLGTPPADIMQGAIESLVTRAAQLMKRVKGQPEYTLIGGLLRFPTMADAVRRSMKAEVNVPEGEMVQFTASLGAAILGHLRLKKLRDESVDPRKPVAASS